MAFGAVHVPLANIWDALTGQAEEGPLRQIIVELRLPRAEARPPRHGDTPGCEWPWHSAYVTRTGRVQPCCMLMGGDRAVLGDLAHASFDEIWRQTPIP